MTVPAGLAPAAGCPGRHAATGGSSHWMSLPCVSTVPEADPMSPGPCPGLNP
jgi:hypothetical protein